MNQRGAASIRTPNPRRPNGSLLLKPCGESCRLEVSGGTSGAAVPSYVCRWARYFFSCSSTNPMGRFFASGGYEFADGFEDAGESPGPGRCVRRIVSTNVRARPLKDSPTLCLSFARNCKHSPTTVAPGMPHQTALPAVHVSLASDQQLPSPSRNIRADVRSFSGNPVPGRWLCAERRTVQEGWSPSVARMRSDISKSGAEPRWPEKVEYGEA